MRDDRMELAGLAHRRYPDSALDMALLQFESDRRHAGLGALDERRRRTGGEVNNYKRDVWEHGQVRYHLVRKTRPRLEYARQEVPDIPLDASAAEMTVQLVQKPGRDQHLVVPVAHSMLRDQSGRRFVARELRQARRQLRLEESACVRNCSKLSTGWETAVSEGKKWSER